MWEVGARGLGRGAQNSSIQFINGFHRQGKRRGVGVRFLGCEFAGVARRKKYDAIL